MGILFLSDGFKHIASTKPNHEDSFFTLDMGSEAGKREIKKREIKRQASAKSRIPDSLNVTCTDCADVLRSVLRFKRVS